MFCIQSILRALNAWNPHALFMLFCLSKADEGFISFLFNNFSQAIKFMITKSNAFCYFYFGVYPKFCFTGGTDNMNMYSGFFTGKEEKTIIFIPEYCWTHKRSLISKNYLIIQIFYNLVKNTSINACKNIISCSNPNIL